MKFRYAALSGIALAFIWAFPSLGESSYPAKPITVVVPFAPGGSADLTTRIIGEKISAKLGEPVVVENRPGAGGEVAVASIVRSDPDGYKLLSTTNGPAVVVGNFRQTSYDVSTDLEAVAMLVKVPTAIAVNASLPVHTISELIRFSKDQPQGLNYSNAGVGTHMHLAGEIFKAKTGAKLVAVPYRGTALAALAVKSGETLVGIADLTTLMPLRTDGSIRILGLIDSTRTAVAPDIPTIAEGGVSGFGLDAWIGVFAPKGTPPNVVSQLNELITRALGLPDVRQKLISAGLDPWPLSPGAMTSFVKEDISRWADLLREANVSIQ